jgi:F-type H+-transporting ATPase subunit gamma
MTTLRDIRRRLKTAENIKKITDAMERVAAARLRRAQQLAEQSRPYSAKLGELVKKLATIRDLNDPLFEKRAIRKSALIVVSADKGLSGSYNSTLLSASDRFLKDYTIQNMDLFLIGRKAKEHYQRTQWPVEFYKSDWAGKISWPEIQEFSDQMVNHFLSGKYDDIWLIYTHYVSIARRDVVVKKFLNIERPKVTSPGAILSYIFEPNSSEILHKMLPRYCATQIQGALYESHASELGARIMAMQMASKNSQEMMEALTLVRNKVRQEGITREMIEISSGANR